MFSAIELAVGDIHAERYDLAEARRWVEPARTRIGSSAQPDEQAAGHLTLARLLWAEGDADNATAELDQAVRYQQAAHLPPLMSRTIDSFRVYVWLARGDLAAAEQWIEADRLRPERTCLQREVGGQIRGTRTRRAGRRARRRESARRSDRRAAAARGGRQVRAAAGAP